MEPDELQAHVQARLDALKRDDLRLVVTQCSETLKVTYGPERYSRYLSYDATPERVDALVAEMAAKPSKSQPKPDDPAPSRSKARRYRALINEGGDGFNPHDE
jgi:hypothetical protein